MVPSVECVQEVGLVGDIRDRVDVIRKWHETEPSDGSAIVPATVTRTKTELVRP